MANDVLNRKLAAILHADVVGYSRLMGEDETSTHRTLSDYLDAISALVNDHQGRVVNYAGDAVLADFSTVSDALRCAVAIQEDLKVRNRDLPDERRLQFRIGVNLGEVIVDRSDIYGDGVNVAARLESLANPGGICISGTVYDAIGGKLTSLRYAFMGEQKVKNIAQPVRAYRVESTKSSQHRPPCPYPGMVPFAAKDAGHFHGRDGEISQIIQLLRRQRFLMVIGPSGSGKSSLVYAGLLPTLEQSRYFDRGYWLIRSMRPGPRPTDVLARLLGVASAKAPFEYDTVQALLAEHPPAQRLLLLVDQFEEVFTQTQHEERARFIAALQALRTPENCALVLTLRADFFPDLMTSYLWPVDASQRVEVTPLRGEALQAAIENPAADVGVRLEKRLIDQLMTDAADEPGALPLLQETMSLLWDEMEQRLLSYQAYEKLSGAGASRAGDEAHSGLAAAMAMKADAALAALSPPQQAIARRIFLRLIQFGEGRADTRRQQSVVALQTITDEAGSFEHTLEHLTDHRLLTRSGGGEGGVALVDIAHEALIDGWSRLQTWIRERREAEQIRRRLESKALEWVRLGKATGGLLDEAELPEADRWLASPDATDLGVGEYLPELVEASRHLLAERETARQQQLQQAEALAKEQELRLAEQARGAVRTRRAIVGLAAILAVAIGAALFAWRQSEIAQQHAQEAEQRRHEAQQANETARLVAEAEKAARQEAEQARFSSLAQLLLIEAEQQYAIDRDERGALLARQAYLYSANGQELLKQKVDGVLRRLSMEPYFVAILSPMSTQAVALSPTSALLASTHIQNATVLLHDLDDPTHVPRTLTGYPGDSNGRLYALGFSQDGKRLAAGNEAGGVFIWSVESPQLPPVELPSSAIGVWSLAFSPDGRYLALGASHGDAFQVWDIQNDPALIYGMPNQTPGEHPIINQLPGDMAVAFSPDGLFLATGGPTGIISLWEVNAWQQPKTQLIGHEGRVAALAFSADSQTLVSGGQDTSIRRWNVSREEAISLQRDPEKQEIMSVAISPDGNYLASTGFNSGAFLWSVTAADANPVKLYNNNYNVAFSADSEYLATSTPGDNGARLWSLAPSGEPLSFSVEEGGIRSVAFSPDGLRLATGGGRSDKTLRVWQVDQLDSPPTAFLTDSYIGAVAFSPDGKQLVAVGGNDKVRVFQLEPELMLETTLDTPGEPYSAAYSPDGKTLAVGSAYGIYLWDRNDIGADPRLLKLGTDWMTEIVFSPGGNLLAVAGEDGIIYLQNMNDFAAPPVKLLSNESRIWSIDFSPDGRFLVSGGRDNSVRLWDLSSSVTAPTFVARHDDGVVRVRFSHDGKHFASSSTDKSIRIWQTADPSAIPVVLHNETFFWSIAVSPDGKLLAGGGRDGLARLWNLSHPALNLNTVGIADLLCQKVRRNLTREEWVKFIGDDVTYNSTCPNLPENPNVSKVNAK